MMTINAQDELNVSNVNENVAINCNEKHYDFIANELSASYRDHLYNGLEMDSLVASEVDFADSERYSEENRSKLINANRIAANSHLYKDYAQPRAKMVKTFDRKKTSILVMYVVMVLAIVTTLILTIPGTAWEREGVDFSHGTATVAIAASNSLSVADQGLNIVMTENGPVTIELTPYDKQPTEHTNWFDKLCDWVSNIFGG